MAKSAKKANTKHSKPLSPQKKQGESTTKRKRTALGRHMERIKVKK